MGGWVAGLDELLGGWVGGWVGGPTSSPFSLRPYHHFLFSLLRISMRSLGWRGSSCVPLGEKAANARKISPRQGKVGGWVGGWVIG